MFRLIASFALVLATPGALLAAGSSQTQQTSTAQNSQKLVDEIAKREDLERRLLIREAADELEAAQTQQAYSRFEIWTGVVITLFSALLTLLILWFGFKTEKAAAAAAMAAAKDEFSQVSQQIRDELEGAKRAAKDAQSAAESAVSQLKRATESADQAALNQQRTAVAAQLVGLSMPTTSDTGDTPTTLSSDQAQFVNSAAEITNEKPESDWTVDEYKVRIWQALNSGRDYKSAYQLAERMGQKYAGDENALSFALRHKGDALRKMDKRDEAIESYDALIRNLEASETPDRKRDLIWAMHHKAVCLCEMGQPDRAELGFQKVLPLCAQVDGVEHKNTLGIRHELGIALLDQDRPKEAEKIFDALIPLYEKVVGTDHSYTLVVQHSHARSLLAQKKSHEAAQAFGDLIPKVENADGAESSSAYITRIYYANAVLDSGDASSAREITSVIPENPQGEDWRRHHSAALAFIRARVSDALGLADDAKRWLDLAEDHYAVCLPEDHVQRRTFIEYLGSRDSRPCTHK